MTPVGGFSCGAFLRRHEVLLLAVKPPLGLRDQAGCLARRLAWRRANAVGQGGTAAPVPGRRSAAVKKYWHPIGAGT
jgi:hypothetical protein